MSVAELSIERNRPRRLAGRFLDWLLAVRTSTVVVLSLVTGLVVSSLVIVLSVEELRIAWGDALSDPGSALGDTVSFLRRSYSGLLQGAFGNPSLFADAFADPTWDNWSSALRPFATTVTNAVPLAIAGLGLSIAYRSGVFNIGAESQIVGGAIAASWVGFGADGLPAAVHVPLALLAGLAGGAVAGLIPGLLKAFANANEVIVTIMLNYVAANLLLFLLTSTFFRNTASGSSAPVGRPTPGSAALPKILGNGLPVNLGFVVAVVALIGTATFLSRSKLGFELQIAGSSRGAAATAGIDPRRVGVLALVISGAVVGLAGAVQVLGVVGQLQTSLGTNIGVLAITVALVGRNRPLGVAFAALLYGALQAGGLEMQLESGVSYQLTNVLQALIVLFMTAPVLVVVIYRLRTRPDGRGTNILDTTTMAKGWES